MGFEPSYAGSGKLFCRGEGADCNEAQRRCKAGCRWEVPPGAFRGCFGVRIAARDTLQPGASDNALVWLGVERVQDVSK